VGSLRYSLLLQVATTSAWLVATVRYVLQSITCLQLQRIQHLDLRTAGHAGSV
jgi:hypothetical protein